MKSFSSNPLYNHNFELCFHRVWSRGSSLRNGSRADSCSCLRNLGTVQNVGVAASPVELSAESTTHWLKHQPIGWNSTDGYLLRCSPTQWQWPVTIIFTGFQIPILIHFPLEGDHPERYSFFSLLAHVVHMEEGITIVMTATKNI